ncbi:hypothetical protein RVO95_13100, partial [Klebsiella michiganensis]|uniref:hypothetical protein n=1 Tax=Klebsiella michiganensis TaxID=1134687 RepID=UPI002928DCCC
DIIIYYQEVIHFICHRRGLLPTLITVIFLTPFSGTCRLIIEMILVISLMKQMNVLNNKRLLNFRTKKRLFGDAGHIV